MERRDEAGDHAELCALEFGSSSQSAGRPLKDRSSDGSGGEGGCVFRDDQIRVLNRSLWRQKGV